MTKRPKNSKKKQVKVKTPTEKTTISTGNITETGHASFAFFQRYAYLVLVVILLLTLAFRYAEPVKDSDLFFHLKYAQYMVDNQTLIPDHSIYSWTPARNDIIYCSWLGSIALYGLYQVGGLPMLFALRYLLLLAAMAIVWGFAWKMKQVSKASTWLILMVYLVASLPGTFLKPELFSLLFLVIVAGLYYSIKAGIWPRFQGRLFLLLPLIFLVWVNTHGVFLFGFVILCVITFGELLNTWFGQRHALDRQAVISLIASTGLSGLAILVTPYGWDYPRQIVENLAAGNAALSTVAAYLSIFDPGIGLTHVAEFWTAMLISMGLCLTVFIYQQRSVDWALLLSNVFLCWISAQFLRTFFLWAPFWAIGMIYLIDRIQWPSWKKTTAFVQTAAFLACLFVSGRAIYETAYRPFFGRYLGFGIGYFNPVQASSFVKAHRPGQKMYNSYNTGGYLLWDLYPEQQVFCDARYFPYRDWYDEYYAFNNGNLPLEAFHDKYPFDFAVVDYQSSQSPILKFLRSGKWRPVFYGTSAMVFVKSDAEFEHEYRKDDRHRFDDVRNLVQARVCFYMAQNLEDLTMARHILDMMKRKFRRHYGAEVILANLTRMQEGIEAFHDGRYAYALAQMEELDFEMTPKIVFTLLQLRNWQCKEFIKKGRLTDALKQLELALELEPLYADALYNAGVLAYQVERQRRAADNSESSSNLPSSILELSDRLNEAKWRRYLERLLKVQPDHRHADIAKQLLEGKGLSGQVPLAL